jgi:phosphopantothenoylcysteine decarboxylase/phosphopantothenate--cysteine ligase
MYDAVVADYSDLDVLIMAAAVADFRPVSAADQKIKKRHATMSIELEPTRDILGATADCEPRPLRIGFAAETTNVAEYAREKVLSKRLDMIVANDVSRVDSGFGTDTNLVTLFRGDGLAIDCPLMSKREVADVILDQVVMLGSQRA